MKKMIVVTSRGYVTTSRGKAFAPIRHPYKEDVKTIFSMLTKDRATVKEVLSDGTTVELNIQNFDKDNTVRTTTEPVASPTPVVAPVSAPVEQPSVMEETDDGVLDEPMDTFTENSDDDDVQQGDTPVDPAENSNNGQYRGKNRNKSRR